MPRITSNYPCPPSGLISRVLALPLSPVPEPFFNAHLASTITLPSQLRSWTDKGTVSNLITFTTMVVGWFLAEAVRGFEMRSI